MCTRMLTERPTRRKSWLSQLLGYCTRN